MKFFNIGDASADGRVEIIDEDKLCYQVKNISKGLEHVLQSDSAATSPDSVSARVYRMIIDLIKAKQIQDYQLQVGNRHTDAG